MADAGVDARRAACRCERWHLRRHGARRATSSVRASRRTGSCLMTCREPPGPRPRPPPSGPRSRSRPAPSPSPRSCRARASATERPGGPSAPRASRRPAGRATATATLAPRSPGRRPGARTTGARRRGRLHGRARGRRHGPPRWSTRDLFVLLGRQGDARSGRAIWRAQRNTIAWEVLSSMAARVGRVYDPTTARRGGPRTRPSSPADCRRAHERGTRGPRRRVAGGSVEPRGGTAFASPRLRSACARALRPMAASTPMTSRSSLARSSFVARRSPRSCSSRPAAAARRSTARRCSSSTRSSAGSSGATSPRARSLLADDDGIERLIDRLEELYDEVGLDA